MIAKVKSIQVTAQMVGAAGAVLAVLIVLFVAEVKKRSRLIDTASACMDGDQDECAIYDDEVVKTKAWKLNLAIKKLPMTNLLAEKLAGPPPAGFAWGKTF